MHNIMIYFSLHQCTISYDLLFLTLEWEVSYIKGQSQIAHSAPTNLCSQTPPLTLSLSQVIELEEEAEDEPKLFTRTNKKQYKKDRLIYALRAYINKCIIENFLLEIEKIIKNFSNPDISFPKNNIQLYTLWTHDYKIHIKKITFLACQKAYVK